MAVGTFISTGRSLDKAVERVKLAEQLGFESAWITQIAGRDAHTVLTIYACATERIRLGTGVVPIYTRTPATMAQVAATLDEFSGGRHNLGIGVSHRPVVEGWHGQTIDKPVAEMREYASTVRSILRGEEVTDTAKWPTGFRLMGLDPRPQLPIYIAGLSPGMLKLAGEIADGVVLWLCNPRYIADVVVPCVREGRERAGKELDGFDVVAAVPGAATGDPEAARNAMRGDLLPYFGLPFYRKMIERSGFGDDIARYDEAAAGGDVEGMKAGISDEFLGVLCAIGDDEELCTGVERYHEAGATSPCIGPIPGTDFEATLSAASALV